MDEDTDRIMKNHAPKIAHGARRHNPNAVNAAGTNNGMP